MVCVHRPAEFVVEIWTVIGVGGSFPSGKI